MRRAELTREKLIESFWSLYSQKSLEHISIKEITIKAGYHRGTFYEYFFDIHDLLDKQEEELLNYIKEKGLCNPGEEYDEDFVPRLADVYESKGKYLSILLGENGDPDFILRLKAMMNSALGQSYGLSESEIHTSYIMEFVLSGTISTIGHWYKTGKNLSSQELVYLIRSMLVEGVEPIVQKHLTHPDLSAAIK